MSKTLNVEFRLFGQNLSSIIQDILDRLDALEVEKTLNETIKQINESSLQIGISAEEAVTALLEVNKKLGGNAHVEGMCNHACGEYSYAEGYCNDNSKRPVLFEGSNIDPKIEVKTINPQIIREEGVKIDFDS